MPSDWLEAICNFGAEFLKPDFVDDFSVVNSKPRFMLFFDELIFKLCLEAAFRLWFDTFSISLDLLRFKFATL